MASGVDVGRVRQLNRRLVLRELRDHGRATRAKLAKATGLTHATVSAIVGDLIDEGWVRELGIGPIPRGRPPVLLEIDPDRHCCVGLQIGPERTRIAVLDALGRTVATRDARTRSRVAKTVCGQAARLVQETVRGAGVDWQRIHAVGVCLPGPVDPATGVIPDLPDLGWQNEPIRQLLADALGVPVEVYDDTYVLACLELLEGTARESKNAVFLSVTAAPNAALIVEGKVHRGASGFAGTIGHMQMPGLSERCRCGNVGCLRTVVSREAVARRAQELHRRGNRDLDPARLDEVPALALIEAAAAGSAAATEVLNEISVHLVRATGWVVTLVNPDMLILGGDLSPLPEPVLGPFREGVLAACHPAIAARLRIEKSMFRGADRARAAAVVILHESVDHLDALFHDSEAAGVA
ncbi:MAG: ROK family transcriptional regulator [Myxococcota bacterium]|nr:ROK family transcriptional regulator [Myxococcota bacterium]